MEHKEDFELVVEQHRNLIYSIIRKLHIYKGAVILHEQDLFQEGLIALHEAYLQYDKRFDNSFCTFAYTVIRRRLVRIVQKHNQKACKEVFSYDGLEKLDYFDEYKVIYQYKDEINDLSKRLKRYMKQFNRNDQYILQQYLKQKSYKDIARNLQTTTKYIDNRLQKIKKQVQLNYLQEEGEHYYRKNVS